MNELALFAGHGGGILGGCLLGWRTVCAVEIDDKARQRLMDRQNDGSLRPFPIWDDVRTFDGKPWSGRVDVVSGGFPCQDISIAGKGAGITGERSGLWREFARIICEVRPRYVLVENSPALTVRGLGTVLGDLAQMGFDARWGVLGAVHAGALHRRERIWIVGNSVRYRCQADHGRGFVSDQFWQRQAQKAGWELQQSRSGCPGELANADGLRQSQPQGGQPNERGWTGNGGEQGGMQWWSAEPDVGGTFDGLARRMDLHQAH